MCTPPNYCNYCLNRMSQSARRNAIARQVGIAENEFDALASYHPSIFDELASLPATKRANLAQQAVSQIAEQDQQFADFLEYRDRAKIAHIKSKLAEWANSPAKVPSGRSVSYNYHPDITPNNEPRVTHNASLLLGLSESEYLAQVREEQERGSSLTQAHRTVFSRHPLRADADDVVIGVDLETAGKAFGGDTNYIIEMGVCDIDGNPLLDRLYGLNEDAVQTIGTGWVEGHHITPEMIEGKAKFFSPEAQREALSQLEGKIMVAHNARFEINMLNDNLYGFRQACEEGRIKVVDTHVIVQFFMPETPTNKNQSFVECTGGEYSDQAHRAFEDASMTLSALRRLMARDASR